jgi:hypothetical protein
MDHKIGFAGLATAIGGGFVAYLGSHCDAGTQQLAGSLVALAGVIVTYFSQPPKKDP